MVAAWRNYTHRIHFTQISAVSKKPDHFRGSSVEVPRNFHEISVNVITCTWKSAYYTEFYLIQCLLLLPLQHCGLPDDWPITERDADWLLTNISPSEGLELPRNLHRSGRTSWILPKYLILHTMSSYVQTYNNDKSSVLKNVQYPASTLKLIRCDGGVVVIYL